MLRRLLRWRRAPQGLGGVVIAHLVVGPMPPTVPHVAITTTSAVTVRSSMATGVTTALIARTNTAMGCAVAVAMAMAMTMTMTVAVAVAVARGHPVLPPVELTPHTTPRRPPGRTRRHIRRV